MIVASAAHVANLSSNWFQTSESSYSKGERRSTKTFFQFSKSTPSCRLPLSLVFHRELTSQSNWRRRPVMFSLFSKNKLPFRTLTSNLCKWQMRRRRWWKSVVKKRWDWWNLFERYETLLRSFMKTCHLNSLHSRLRWLTHCFAFVENKGKIAGSRTRWKR